MTSVFLFIGSLMRFLATEYFLTSLMIFMFIMVACAYIIHIGSDLRKIFVAYVVLFIMLALLFSLVVIRDEINDYDNPDRTAGSPRTADLVCLVQ